MADEEQVSEQEALQNLYNFVAAEMRAGTTKSEIARKLEEQGIDRSEAQKMTNTIYDGIVEVVRREQYSSSALLPGLVGGLLAALIGGGVWAAIAVAADYELGIIAWGIGGLCGFAVVMFAKGRKGVPLQVVAMVTSILGIAIGKYLTFYYLLRQAVLGELGEEGIAEMTPFSPGVLRYFAESAPQMVSGYDILWVILAVYTAWRIPKGSDIKPDSTIAQSPITPG